MTFPCKDCHYRYPACHSSCNKYIEAKQAYLELKHSKIDYAGSYTADQIRKNRDYFAKQRKNHKLKTGCIR